MNDVFFIYLLKMVLMNFGLLDLLVLCANSKKFRDLIRR